MNNNYKALFIQNKTCNLIELPCHHWLLTSNRVPIIKTNQCLVTSYKHYKNFQILDNLKVKRTIRDTKYKSIQTTMTEKSQ